MATLDATKLHGPRLRTRQTAGQRRIMAADRTAAHPPHLVMIGGRTDARRRLMAADRTAARRRLRPLVAAEAPTDARCPRMVEVVAAQCRLTAVAEASEAAGERRPMAAVAVAAEGLPEAVAVAADMPQLRATALGVVVPHTEATVTKLYL